MTASNENGSASSERQRSEQTVESNSKQVKKCGENSSLIIQGSDPCHDPSFTLENRIRRQIWNIARALLFRSSPRPLHVWRSFLLRLFGAEIGIGCHVYPGVRIWAPWNLRLGNYVGVADEVILYCMDKIDVGDYAVISHGAHLCCGTHDYNTDNFQLTVKPIVIGSRAWICAEAFVHPGVTVPEGAVVGARAVVTKSLVEPWTVYSGNPCRSIGTRRRTLVQNE